MVYFVTTLDRKLCKVGWSRDPHRRYREIQAANPQALELLGFIPGEKSLEQRLHRSFWGLRLDPGSEWFEVRGRLLALLEHLNLLEVKYSGLSKYAHMARGIFWDVWTDAELDRVVEFPETAWSQMHARIMGPTHFPEIDPVDPGWPCSALNGSAS